MLEIQVLGGWVVRHNGAPIQLFRTQKVRALLVYLVLQSARAHVRTLLADLFWPDVPAARAAQSLRQALTFLRQGLAHGNAAANLVITRQSVHLTPGPTLQVDLLNLATLLDRPHAADLAQAVALYHGPLLDGFYLDDAPEFETWLLAEREHWQVKILSTLNQLADSHRVRGEYSLAQSYLQRAIALDPWHEQTHRELIRLLALQGDVAGALAHYEKAQQTLQTNLGVTPLAETRALAEQLRQGLFPTAPKPDNLSFLPFVGRGDEHARLAAAITHLPRPRLLLLEGASGIGKTRLLTEFMQYTSSQGAICLSGRCLPFAVPVPYQPLVTMLRAALPHQHEPIAPVWRAELARLLPELSTPSPDPVAVDSFGDGAERQRLFTGVAQLFQAISPPHQPVLLLFDDLHWADTASLDVMQFLLHQPLPRLLLLGSVRSEDVANNSPLQKLLRGLGRERLVERLHLAPLPEVAVQAMVGHWVSGEDAAALSHFLYHESEGNPFVLSELLYDLVEGLQPGPPPWQLPPNWLAQAPHLTAGLRDVWLDRVERLAPDSLRALQIAAVIGHTFAPDILDAVAGQATAVWQQDWQLRHLIRPPNGADLHAVTATLEFSHDKIRAVVYEMMPLAQRQDWHEAIARIVAQRGERAAATLAHHFFHSPHPSQALPYFLQAVQDATAVLAFAEVVILCTQALSFDAIPLATQYELLRQRQRAYQFLGDTEGEGRDAAALLQVAQQSGDPQQLADAVQRLGRLYYLRGQVAEARQAITEILQVARAGGQVEVVVRVLNMLAMLFRETVHGQAEALRLQAEALEITRAAAQPIFAALLLCDTGVILAEKGDYGAALASVQEGLLLLRANDAAGYLPHALYILGGLWREIGQYAAAQTVLAEASTLCQRLGVATYWLSVDLERGHLALDMDQTEQARQHYRRAAQLAAKANRPLGVARAAMGLGVAAYLDSDFGTAQTHLERAIVLCGRDDRRICFLAQAWLGLVLCGRERVETAVQVIEAGMAEAERGELVMLARPRLYWHYFRILQSAGQLPTAQHWQNQAYTLLLIQSQTVPDEWRHDFLQAILLHRQIMRSGNR